MATLKKLLLVSAGTLVLGMALAVTPAGPVIADSMKPLLTRIINTPDDPVPVRDVDIAGREPVALGQRLVGLDQEAHVLTTVPEGKRLVIEMITVSASMGSHLSPSANLFTTSGGNGNQHQIALNHVHTGDGVSRYQATHLVRLYADPAAQVKVFVGFAGDDEEWKDRVAAVSLSGYLIDAV